jgi:hypothetical protein
LERVALRRPFGQQAAVSTAVLANPESDQGAPCFIVADGDADAVSHRRECTQLNGGLPHRCLKCGLTGRRLTRPMRRLPSVGAVHGQPTGSGRSLGDGGTGVQPTESQGWPPASAHRLSSWPRRSRRVLWSEGMAIHYASEPGESPNSTNFLLAALQTLASQSACDRHPPLG